MKVTLHMILMMVFAMPGVCQELGEYISRANAHFNGDAEIALNVDYVLYSDSDFKVVKERKSGRYIKKGHRFVMRMEGDLIIQDEDYRVTISKTQQGVIVSRRDTSSTGLEGLFTLENLEPLFERVSYEGEVQKGSERFVIILKDVPGNEVSTFQMDFDKNDGALKRLRLQFRALELSNYGDKEATTTAPSIEITYRKTSFSSNNLLNSTHVITWKGSTPTLTEPYKGYSIINNTSR